jgi:hypothetical protein
VPWTNNCTSGEDCTEICSACSTHSLTRSLCHLRAGGRMCCNTCMHELD